MTEFEEEKCHLYENYEFGILLVMRAYICVHEFYLKCTQVTAKKVSEMQLLQAYIRISLTNGFFWAGV